MQELITEIGALYEEFKTNAMVNAEKGNKAAGTRARKAALNLMSKFKEYRKASVEADKA